MGVIAACLLSSAAHGQLNELREPRSLARSQGAKPLASHHPAAAHPANAQEASVQQLSYQTSFGHQYPVTRTSHSADAVSTSMARTAVYQRARDHRRGNAIRLTEHVESESEIDHSGPALRWVDPGTPGSRLTDQANSWTKRGESSSSANDAMSQPFSKAPAVAVPSAPYAQNYPNFGQDAGPKPREAASPRFSAPQDAPPANQDNPLLRPFDDPQAGPERSRPEDAPTPFQAPPTPFQAPPSTDPSTELAPEGSEPLPQAGPLDNPAGPSGDAPAPAPGLLEDVGPGESLSDLPQDDAAYYADDVSYRNCAAEQERCKRNVLTSIREISLDITPDFAFDIESATERQQLREQRLSDSPSRQWYDVQGQPLASGRMVNYTQGEVHIVDDADQLQRIPAYQLGRAERCFVAAWWKLPLDCHVTDGTPVPRQFTPMTMTWTASALCSQPAYFEQRELERYGHSAHPLIQPALSGAHFFASIATLPYKAGIHPIHECQYDLGYYRPGSCAPWLLPPVPISLRGALLQAGVVVGGVNLLP